MNENDILSSIKEKMREELSRIANQEIDNLAHKFYCAMGKHKAEFIASIINDIEFVAMENQLNREITFQINIKGGANNDR